MRARRRAAGCTGRRSPPTSPIRSIRPIRPKCWPTSPPPRMPPRRSTATTRRRSSTSELKAKLAELRGQGDGPATQIADGPALKYTPARGKKQPEIVMEDPRVPQLRAKLGISENADDTHYDAKVAEAVRKFQESADLKATGVLDERHRQGASTARSATSRSTPCSSTWSAGAGCRVTSARPRSAMPMSSSTFPTIRSR